MIVGRFGFAEKWVEFIESRDKKNDVPKDVWNMLLEFMEATNEGGLDAYYADSAWPVIIDDFVEYVTSQ